LTNRFIGYSQVVTTQLVLTLSDYFNYKTHNKVISVCLLSNPINLEKSVASRILFLSHLLECPLLSKAHQFTSHCLLWSICSTRATVRDTLRLAVYRQSVCLGAEPLETHGQNCFSQLNTCAHSPFIKSSLMIGWVCHLQLLLVLASVFILGSQYRGTRDHILLSQIRDFLFVEASTICSGLE
jgi:hypothetical protein